jgi:hypothetical protein
MLGFLSSQERLLRSDDEGGKSPAVNSLGTLMCGIPRNWIPMVHYHSTDKDTLAAQVGAVLYDTGIYRDGSCTAVQLNVDWPPLEQIKRMRGQMPELDIVLQLPERAMAGMDAAQIAERAAAYDGLVAYTLIDPSGGKGVALDVDRTGAILSALADAMPRTTLGFAGGLSANGLDTTIRDVMTAYSSLQGVPFCGGRYEVCIDSQKKLRHECDGFKGIDYGAMNEYLVAANRICA